MNFEEVMVQSFWELPFLKKEPIKKGSSLLLLLLLQKPKRV